MVAESPGLNEERAQYAKVEVCSDNLVRPNKNLLTGWKDDRFDTCFVEWLR